MQTEGGYSARDVGVNHPGLDHDKAVGLIHFQNLAHAGHLDDHALVERQGAARKPGSGPARRKRHAGPRQHTHDFRGLFSCGREHHRAGAILVLRKAVTLVDEQLVGFSKNIAGSKHRPQVFYQLVHR